MSTTAIPLRAALSTNSTSTAFTAKIPKATEPSGDGVFDLRSASVAVGVGVNVPSYVEIIPFGTDGNNDTFDMRLIGWSQVGVSSLWVPRTLAEMSVTLGNISGAAIASNTFMADTIVLDKGAADGAFTSIISTADDTTASILIHTRGCRYIEFDWDLAGGQEGVSMNCYWRPVD